MPLWVGLKAKCASPPLIIFSNHLKYLKYLLRYGFRGLLNGMNLVIVYCSELATAQVQFVAVTIALVIELWLSVLAIDRVEPIVLKILMIMLCCTAHEMCHLCS